MKRLVKKVFMRILSIFPLPLRDEIIFESHPDFSDNSYALYEYFLKKGVNEKYRIHWALHNEDQYGLQLPENVDTFYLNANGFKNMWKKFRAIYCSKYIIDGNSFIYKCRKDQIRIHLGHGMLIKITKGYHDAQKIGDCDNFLVTSPYWFDVFEKKVGLDKKCLLPLGYPRNDVLLEKRKWKNNLGDYLVWMPTYRQHREIEEISLKCQYPYGMPEITDLKQLKVLDNYLEIEKVKIYFRPHPAQDIRTISEAEMKNIIIADDLFLKKSKLTLYEILAAAKALITDYSSVYFDFLLTGKPIGLTVGDIEEYFSIYDCAFSDITKELEGVFIRSFEELLDFISKVIENKEIMSEEYKLSKNKFHQIQDGTSTEKIYEYIKGNYGF